MRRIISLFISLLIALLCINCNVLADDLPVYSTVAADQICYFWNKYFSDNDLDLSCGYFRTEDQQQIESFSIIFNGDKLDYDYMSGVIPSSAYLLFLYNPLEHSYGFCAFSADMKSDLEKAVIYTDDGIINNIYAGSSHEQNDMWCVTLQEEDFITLMNCDQFTVKLTIDGKNEVFDISKEHYNYLFAMVEWLIRAQLYADTTYENYLGVQYLPDGVRSAQDREEPAAEEYSFREDLDAIDQAAKSSFYVEVYDENNNCFGRASGFVSFDEHLFVTNQHVIQDAYYLRVEDEEGNRYILDKVIVSDEIHDIAILLFPEGINYRSLEIDTDEELKRGQKIVTIGNPIGYKGTVAFGNISAFPEIEDLGKCIQFTAPISHGSSGGCLFDDNGKVIGVTSAGGVSEYTGEKGENIGLAVPVSVVRDLYNQWDKSSYETLGTVRSWNIVGVTPTPKPTSEPVEAESLPVETFINRYGVIIRLVNFRKGPSVNEPVAGNPAKEGQYVYIIMNEVNSRSEVWSKVNYNGKIGYIKSDNIYVLSEEESAAYDRSKSSPAPVYSPTPEPSPVPDNVESLPIGVYLNRYGVINRLVNFRQGPSADTPLAGGPVKVGEYVYLISNEKNSKNEVWTKVIYKGVEGYIKSEHIYVINEN